MQRFLLRCGVAAPIIYVVTVLLGGLITPDYSHVSQAISELIATGAPFKALLDICFLVYNAVVFLFAIGLLWRLWSYRRRPLFAAAILLALLAVAGILTYFAPMDPPEGPVTLMGQLHLVLAAVSALLTIVATLLAGMGFWGQPGWRIMSFYSFLSTVVILASGMMAFVGVASGSPILGLYERVTIGTFMLWMLILALVAGRRVPQAESQAAAPAPTAAEPQVPTQAQAEADQGPKGDQTA